MGSVCVFSSSGYDSYLNSACSGSVCMLVTDAWQRGPDLLVKATLDDVRREVGGKKMWSALTSRSRPMTGMSHSLYPAKQRQMEE